MAADVICFDVGNILSCLFRFGMCAGGLPPEVKCPGGVGGGGGGGESYLKISCPRTLHFELSAPDILLRSKYPT